MISAAIAASIFVVLLAVLAVFQLALAAGAPWGSLAMGGRFPGKFPPAMRIAALVQIAVYALMGAVVLSAAELALPGWYAFSRATVWIVVGMMALGSVLNLITPSKWERRLWAPVALVMFAAALRVATV